MKHRRFTIYCHTCTVTWKKYVGQTVNTMEKRWKAHVSRARYNDQSTCRAFAAAIRKYGSEVWTHEVLDVVFTQKGANRAEKVWIKHHDCLAPNGYNLDDGGKSAIKSDETRQKMREAWARKTPEQKAQCGTGKWGTPSERSEVARTWQAKKTPEQRSVSATKRSHSWTPEQYSEWSRALWASKTPEERRALALARHANMSEETKRQRSIKISKAAQARLDAETPEQRTRRSEAGRKSWSTRRANAAKGGS